MSADIAVEAARIRATHGLKAPDSIQLATARVGKATAFLTNDDKFARIPGLELILLEGLLSQP